MTNLARPAGAAAGNQPLSPARGRAARVGMIDMASKRDAETLEAQIGRTFEQMIPFNRVLGLKIDFARSQGAPLEVRHAA